MSSSEQHLEPLEGLTAHQQDQQATEGGQSPQTVDVQSHIPDPGSPGGSPKDIVRRNLAEVQEKETDKKFQNADDETFDDEDKALSEFIHAEDESDAESMGSCASGDEQNGADLEGVTPVVSEDAMGNGFDGNIHEYCNTDGDEENSDDDHAHQHRRKRQNQQVQDHDEEEDGEEQDSEPNTLDDEDDQPTEFELQQNLRTKPQCRSLESDLKSVQHGRATFPADYESAVTADFQDVYEAFLESDTLTIEDCTDEEVFDDQLQQLADRKASLESLKSMAMLELQQASEAMVSALQANFNRADDILTQLTATSVAKIDALAAVVQKAKLAFARNRNFEQKCSESLLL